MLCQFQVYSKVNQLYTYIYFFKNFFRFFFHIGHYRVLSRVPCATQQVLTSYLFFLLGYSCFTVLCQFLLYNEVNQLYVYIYPLPLEPPSPPIPPRQVITEHRAELPVLYSRFPLAICFTHGSVCMSVLISQFVPPSPSPHPHVYHFLTVWHQASELPSLILRFKPRKQYNNTRLAWSSQ